MATSGAAPSPTSPAPGVARHDHPHACYRRHWREERDSAALFAGLAEIERNARRRREYRRLAAIEERHAARFAAKLERAGERVPAFRASWRTRLLLALARRFGTVSVLPRVAMLERRDARRYRTTTASWSPAEEEHANAVWLGEFATHEASEALKRLLLRVRRTAILLVGGALFGVSLALARNAQIEGLVFGLLAGVMLGPVTHYLIGKVAVPFGAGRLWCGWACWTAALLDQLPYRRSPGWSSPRARRWRTLHLAASVILVVSLALLLDYRGGAVGPDAAWWFLAGNVGYWSLGILLAVRSRDNRAFCKYACPVAALLSLTTRPALLKVAGDAQACHDCVSKACTTQCPMSIDVPGFIGAGQRLLATECIQCLHCVAVCPPNTLRLSLGVDLAGPGGLLSGAGAQAAAMPVEGVAADGIAAALQSGSTVSPRRS